MADFVTTGVDDLMREIEMMAEVPDEVIEDMLQAEAEVIKAAQIRQLQQMSFKESTGQLERSISSGARMKRDRYGRPSLHVYPGGTRLGKDTTNAEVGFVTEYGAPQRGIAPRPWMRIANELAEEEATHAAQAVYDDWVDETGQ